MRNRIFKIGMLMTVFAMGQVYAFQVRVQTSSPSVSALGYIVNGKKYGKAGTSYVGNHMTKGMYNFGVRVNGLLGKDVPCVSKEGDSSIKLTHSAKVTLEYDNHRCVAEVS